MDYIIVQAGGKGTRLKHLTENKPKALVPVDNLPMLFHLFRKYPDKRYVVIADYQRDVLRKYLFAFANVKYQVVDAEGQGTCAGIRQAIRLIPPRKSFMLIWSDLILPESFDIPIEYRNADNPRSDYIGISKTFQCRWSYKDGIFVEEPSIEHGVAGIFLFTEKNKLNDVPESGELVRWMQQRGMMYQEISMAGTKEFGVLAEYEKLAKDKCRPFNKITIDGNILIKEAIDIQGKSLAEQEWKWYEKAMGKQVDIFPAIYGKEPLKMEYIQGKNIYEYYLEYGEKKRILERIITALRLLHNSEETVADSFSVKESYYNKTMRRLAKIEGLVPFAKEKVIVINDKKCRNIFFYKQEFEKRLEQISCDRFCFIHGDCTFSNIMLRNDGRPVLIDPRGYFGYTEIFGDERYDWAKLYYSIIGNYDKFNLKDFRLKIKDDKVYLNIESNHWEDMEQDFFELTGADQYEIKLLHAVIWLSLTTYAWQDYDSICGAFYNGLYYLEDVL